MGLAIFGKKGMVIMNRFDINKLKQVNGILNKSKRSKKMDKDRQASYDRTWSQLQKESKSDHVDSLVMASNTFIFQSAMGDDYHENLSPEMEELMNAVKKAFCNESCKAEISDKYDEEVIRKIVVSNYEINYSSQKPLSTANIIDKNHAYTMKPSNFVFSVGNFLKYLNNMIMFAKGVQDQDVVSIIMVGLGTLGELRSDFTIGMDWDTADFLEFFYREAGYGNGMNEDEVIQKYLEQKEKPYKKNKDDVIKIINNLCKLSVVLIKDGNISIVEKVLV